MFLWALTLSESQVALVCQWGVHQFSSITLVLIGVLELSIHHLNTAQTFPVHVESAKDTHITYQTNNLIFNDHSLLYHQ